MLAELTASRALQICPLQTSCASLDSLNFWKTPITNEKISNGQRLALLNGPFVPLGPAVGEK